MVDLNSNRIPKTETEIGRYFYPSAPYSRLKPEKHIKSEVRQNVQKFSDEKIRNNSPKMLTSGLSAENRLNRK